MDLLLWMIAWGAAYGGANLLWHYIAPEWVNKPERYRRPLYYGIGFVTFLGACLGFGLCTGYLVVPLAATVIGVGGGLGMLTAYALDNVREREEGAALDAALRPPGKDRDGR